MTAAPPPLIKWTGSKRSQAARLWALAPPHRRWVEPFVGGGAMLWLAGPNGALAGDVYPPLVALWRAVQHDPHAFVAAYATRWSRLQTEGHGVFYELRDRFNREGHADDLHFLLRTCVNGIVRFNREGAFNNSLHLTRPGMHPDRLHPIALRWSRRVQGVTFEVADYADTLAQTTADDLVYLDPPYAGSRQRYVADLDPTRLWDALEALNRRGVRWMLSFDGRRDGAAVGGAAPPSDLWLRHLHLPTGASALHRVLHGRRPPVEESVYMNFQVG
jgi:DNA adenine methylase